MAIQFTKATKKKAKLKITLTGPAGSGKTFSALVIAKVLGGRCALVDSEHGRASLYADRFDFETVELQDFSLDTYIAAIRAGAQAGFGVFIIDSLSHAWMGKGGALEEVDRRGGNNKFTNGWKEVTPKQNEMIDTIRAFPGHLICTMRKKMDYVLETNDKGKQVPKKVGLAPVQRDGVEYEFDFIFDLDLNGTIHVTKSSFSELDNAVLTRAELPGAIERIRAWLEEGATPESKPAAPAPAPQASAPANGHAPAPMPPPTNGNGHGAAPLEKVRAIIAGAKSPAELNAAMPLIRGLDKADQNTVRGLFNDRLKEVRRG